MRKYVNPVLTTYDKNKLYIMVIIIASIVGNIFLWHRRIREKSQLSKGTVHEVTVREISESP